MPQQTKASMMNPFRHYIDPSQISCCCHTPGHAHKRVKPQLSRLTCPFPDCRSCKDWKYSLMTSSREFMALSSRFPTCPDNTIRKALLQNNGNVTLATDWLLDLLDCGSRCYTPSPSSICKCTVDCGFSPFKRCTTNVHSRCYFVPDENTVKASVRHITEKPKPRNPSWTETAESDLCSSGSFEFGEGKLEYGMINT